MRSDPEGVLEATIIAVSLEDIQAASSFFAIDADFAVLTPAGAWPFSGKCHGREAIKKRLENVLADFSVERFAAPPILAGDGDLKVQIDFIFRHRASGQVIDGVMRVVARIENGHISRWHEYQDSDRVEAFMRLVRSET